MTRSALVAPLAVLLSAAAPPGALERVPAPAGCAAPADAARTPCVRVRQLHPGAFVLSPDGRNLYTLGGIDDRSAIAALARDQRTGALRQLPGRQGCLLHARGRPFRSCVPARINNPIALAITPDGREIIWTNGAGATLWAAVRSPRTGALTPVDCCGTGRGLARAGAVAVSPDSRHVYVASYQGNGPGLAVYARNRSTGMLVQPDGPAACVKRAGAIGCTNVPAPRFAPVSVVVSPDGTTVYAATIGPSSGLFVFTRNASSGALTNAACYLVSPAPPCLPFFDAQWAGGLALSPDGRFLYVVDSRILVFRVGPGTALSRVAGPRGCLSAHGSAGMCTAAPGLRTPGRAPIFSLDGRTAYVAGGAGILVLIRNQADGSLAPLPRGRGLVRGPRGPIAVSPDGRFVYAGIRDLRTLLVLRRSR